MRLPGARVHDAVVAKRSGHGTTAARVLVVDERDSQGAKFERAIWQRVVERQNHPILTRELAAVQTLSAWAAATRRLDSHFDAGAGTMRHGEAS